MLQPHIRLLQQAEQDTYHDMQAELLNEITRIDLRRNENFCATYPELSKLLNIPVSQF